MRIAEGHHPYRGPRLQPDGPWDRDAQPRGCRGRDEPASQDRSAPGGGAGHGDERRGPVEPPADSPQQSAHETAREGAGNRDERTAPPPTPNGPIGLPSASLRDVARADASQEDGAPARTRTWDRRIRNPRAGSTSDGGPVTCEGASASPSSFPSTRPQESDPDLLTLAKAWPHLPEPLRAGIVAMVRAARGEGKS